MLFSLLTRVASVMLESSNYDTTNFRLPGNESTLALIEEITNNFNRRQSPALFCDVVNRLSTVNCTSQKSVTKDSNILRKIRWRGFEIDPSQFYPIADAFKKLLHAIANLEKVDLENILDEYKRLYPTGSDEEVESPVTRIKELGAMVIDGIFLKLLNVISACVVVGTDFKCTAIRDIFVNHGFPLAAYEFVRWFKHKKAMGTEEIYYELFKEYALMIKAVDLKLNATETTSL